MAGSDPVLHSNGTQNGLVDRKGTTSRVSRVLSTKMWGGEVPTYTIAFWPLYNKKCQSIQISQLIILK